MKKAKKRQKKGQKRVFGKKTALFSKKAFFGPFNRGLASFDGNFCSDKMKNMPILKEKTLKITQLTMGRF